MRENIKTPDDFGSVASHCYADLVRRLKDTSQLRLVAQKRDAVEAADAIDKLAGELRLLIKEVERHGDHDSQFGVGAALDRAWAIVEPAT